MTQRKITWQGLLELHKIIQMRFPHAITKGRVDEGRIRTIADRPYMVLYGHTRYDTIYKRAACYLEGIVRLHPFRDGNKRTAVLVAFAFLQLNGYHLVLPLDTVKFLACIAREGASTEDENDALIDRIAVWLEKHAAADTELLREKITEYIVTPVSNLADLDEKDATDRLNDWLVIDLHPECTIGMDDAVQFSEHVKTGMDASQ